MSWDELGIDETTKKVLSTESGEYVDIPIVDVRHEWKTAKANNAVGGCGLHKNFTYEDLCELENSLFERRLLAGVQTPDVVEYLDEQKKHTKHRIKRSFKKVEETPAEPEVKADGLKELKEKLKKEIMKELLDELKGG